MKNINESLLTACKYGRIENVKNLVEQGGDVNFKGLFETPLINACRGGHHEIVKFLIENGADANDNYFGTNPLIEACIFAVKTELVQVGNAFHFERFVTTQYKQIIKDLCQAGADCTQKDDDGKDAIYHMIERGASKYIDQLFGKKNSLTTSKFVQYIDKVYDNKIIEKDYGRELQE